jgi:hypothetical protein
MSEQEDYQHYSMIIEWDAEDHIYAVVMVR